MYKEASPQALQAVRQRLDKLERFSKSRGFGAQWQNARLVGIRAWNIEVDPSTGLSKAGKNAKVEVIHEIEVDESRFERLCASWKEGSS